jgi:hypothetical protein
MIIGMRENYIKMAVEIMDSTKATDPSMTVPRFLMILVFESFSLSALVEAEFMIN